MADYTPPLRDIKFVLRHISGIKEIVGYPGFEHVDLETIDGALDEAGRFMAEVLAPTNRAGDEIGSQLSDGNVVTPDVFKDAWGKYVEAGWSAVAGPPEYGGHGFPEMIGFIISEMFVSSNLAFSLNPMLTNGTIAVIRDHGDDAVRDTFLEKLVTAEWTGTMVLTESDAGSDVGALRTKAIPNDDGTYRIEGSKIFITWGDHDLTDNIIHLVLARLPDAPPGTKGISLFVVPKMLVNDDGSIGEGNNVETVSLEHKLGIHGSPTAVLSFDGSTGYIIGEPNVGMRYMFEMMNMARREVGLEGLGVSERAYQQAVEYANERKQGRAIGTPKTETSPIIEHPDVRRMLMIMKAYNEAARALLYDAAAADERSHHHPAEAERQAGAARVALLTPVAKAWCSDIGVMTTSLGVQVHGGMGYVEETGAAQHFRDARIAPIYEGTNGIQAIDLVLRKLPMAGGAVVGAFLDEMDVLAATLSEQDDARFATMAESLSAGVAELRGATEWLLAAEDPGDRLTGATAYTEMFGTVAGGYYLGRLALAAAAEDTDAWHEAKIDTATFYAQHILPTAAGLRSSVTAGAAGLFAVPVEGLETAK
ncbi:MAG: acyl-CoA dehydrogenase family protein [Actinomycetota bacterium]